ncbi:MAG: PA0069 family radical SAM protein [Woeseiaceae bacterium]|nr:PA0069 family radical SAM protein [Woeseiaceae bacterium]
MVTRAHKGRGAVSRRDGRFAGQAVVATAEEALRAADAVPETVLTAMRTGRIISHNSSPDVPFDRSINPYQGCEHGCIYCYARPSHSYLDLSPGLDFETRIFYKPDAATRLLEEWEKPGYRCEPITIGANTDPYQPAEKSRRITRELLERFLEQRHPVSLITKGKLVLRDLDILAELAARRLCSVAISLPTLDDGLKRIMEPRAASPAARLEVIRALADRGVPTSVLLAPVIPAINDGEIESVLDAAAAAGAGQASYILLRLPHEVKDLFAEWLHCHFPQRAARVMNLLRQAGGGRLYDPRFGRRQRGSGAYADMLAARFRSAAKRTGLAGGKGRMALDCNQFERPGKRQLGLDF